MAVELRTKLSDAGAAARRRFQGLRGTHEPAITEASTPDGEAAADGQVATTEPSESLVTQAWTGIKRARLVIFIILAVSQALLALVSWRIRVSRGRRGGQGTEEDALEALGEKLGGIAGTIDEG